MYHPEQDYCFRSGCRRASSQAAKRRYRAKQLEEDPDYRSREAARIAAYRVRRRQSSERGAVSVVEGDRFQPLAEVVVGLASHLYGDRGDGEETGVLLHRLRALGREHCERPRQISELFLSCTGSGF